MGLKRIAAYFSEEEYGRVLEVAGEVPLGTWVRNRLMEVIAEEPSKADVEHFRKMKQAEAPKVPGIPVKGASEWSEADKTASRRNEHPLGCNCIHCGKVRKMVESAVTRGKK